MLDATCSPGPNWSIRIRWETPDSPTLLLYLDPECVVIHLPPFSGGDVVLSRFLREVSRNADKLATELEAQRVKGVSPDEPLTPGDAGT